VKDSRARVLVVDDSPTIRSLLSINLWLAGYDVIEASNGQECLVQARSVQPDVITLDVAMPGLDGFATVARLRSDPATAGIPVVIVSARTRASCRQRGSGPPVEGYVTKPFEPAELVALVQSLSPSGETASPR
jgi:CheY-like chemotaxis protein